MFIRTKTGVFNINIVREIRQIKHCDEIEILFFYLEDRELPIGLYCNEIDVQDFFFTLSMGKEIIYNRLHYSAKSAKEYYEYQRNNPNPFSPINSDSEE